MSTAQPSIGIIQKAINSKNKIVYFESSVNYTHVHYINGDKETISYTLKRFEEMLGSTKDFIRIHRSYLVNSRHIQNKNHVEVLMSDGQRLPVARRRRIP